MAVSLYFGLPGSGKTTLLASLAIKGVKKYQHVYSNVPLAVPGVSIITNDCIGVYELRDCLLLIDEGTLYADSRGYKEFSKKSIEYFLTHRHRNADIVIFTQQWDGLDKKIRVITDRVYYVFKGLILGHWITTIWRIPYGILFPDKKRGGDKLGEIVQGYSKPPILTRLFARRLFRPKYYKYFDSWILDPFPSLPASKVKNVANNYAENHPWVYWRNKTVILLRWKRQRDKVKRRQNRKGFVAEKINGYING